MKKASENQGMARREIQTHLDKLWAAKSCAQSARVIKAMKKAGAHVDDRGDNGYTALMMCAMKGHRESMAELLSDGAQVDARSDIEQTALMLAAACDQLGAVEDLLASGADAKAVDSDGDTVLNRGVESSMDLLRVLIEAGADAFMENHRGLNPKKLMEGGVGDVGEKVDRMRGLEAYGEKVSIQMTMGDPPLASNKRGGARGRL